MSFSPERSLIGVCGIGQMGASAAVCFSRAGFRVLLWGRSEEKLASLPGALAALHAFLDEHVGPPAQAVGAIDLTARLEDVDRRADVILECVTEDLGQKIDLLSRLPGAVRRDALLLSCTSGLSITAMARGSSSQGQLVGAHFWNPAHLMPIVEVVRGDDTPAARMEQTVALMLAIGKTPIRVEKDVPGFLGNRLLHALWREALHLVEAGVATPEDIDQAASLTFGLRLPAVGPFANMDLVGLPLLAQIQSYLLADLSTAAGVMPPVADRLARGELGMRTGKGFHDWSQRDPQAVIARRDRQIVQQLRFLRRLDDELPS